MTTSVFYNRDQEEVQEKERKYKWRTEALVVASQACKVQDPWGASTSCYQCGKSGHFKKECPGSKTKPPRPRPACGGDHWRRICPQRQRSVGSEPVSQMVQYDWWVPGLKPPAPATQTAITTQEPWGILEIERRKVDLLLDTGPVSFSSSLIQGPPLPRALP